MLPLFLRNGAILGHSPIRMQLPERPQEALLIYQSFDQAAFQLRITSINMTTCMVMSRSKSVFPRFIYRFSNTVNAFIFVGTNFRGLYKNHTSVGFQIYGHTCSIFLYNPYPKIAISWVLKFVDQTLHKNHENCYPTKLSHPQYLKIFNENLGSKC